MSQIINKRLCLTKLTNVAYFLLIALLNLYPISYTVNMLIVLAESNSIFLLRNKIYLPYYDWQTICFFFFTHQIFFLSSDIHVYIKILYAYFQYPYTIPQQSLYQQQLKSKSFAFEDLMHFQKQSY